MNQERVAFPYRLQMVGAFFELDGAKREADAGEVVERRGEGRFLPMGGEQFVGEGGGGLDAEVFDFIEVGEQDVFLCLVEF